MNCGSCYAFAAISLIEYEAKKTSGRTQILSEQCIVDCLPNGFRCIGKQKLFLQNIIKVIRDLIN